MKGYRVDNLEFDPRVVEGLRAENQGPKRDRVFRIESRVERARLTVHRETTLSRVDTLPRAQPPPRATNQKANQ